MSTLTSSWSRHTSIANATIVLFVCMAIALITVPLIAILAIVCRSRTRRKHRAAQDPENHRLRKIHLQPSKNRRSRGSQPSSKDTTLGSSERLATIAIPNTGSKDIECSSFLSKPMHVPVRLSALQPHQTSPCLPSTLPTTQPKSISRISSISAVSSINTGGISTTSPVSPIAPQTNLGIPEASYQPGKRPSHQDGDNDSGGGRSNHGSSIFVAGHDLFIRAQPNSKRDNEPNTHQFDARKVKVARLELLKGAVKTGKTRREDKWKDIEWKEARTETVDGILAPREWI